MGNSYYKIWRNGEQIEAGYGVVATCDKADCGNKIDRGLAYLCGQTPGGDEHGCGGYFCIQHLTGDQKCQPCTEAADKANAWTNPATGEEFDLRDEYLPEGEAYKPDGWVWKHLGGFQDGVPVLVPVKLQDGKPGGHLGCAITEYRFLLAGGVAWRQELAAKAARTSA